MEGFDLIAVHVHVDLAVVLLAVVAVLQRVPDTASVAQRGLEICDPLPQPGSGRT
jgi:hypothetical protein